jgi:hypothetical protein
MTPLPAARVGHDSQKQQPHCSYHPVPTLLDRSKLAKCLWQLSVSGCSVRDMLLWQLLDSGGPVHKQNNPMVWRVRQRHAISTARSANQHFGQPEQTGKHHCQQHRTPMAAECAPRSAAHITQAPGGQTEQTERHLSPCDSGISSTITCEPYALHPE